MRTGFLLTVLSLAGIAIPAHAEPLKVMSFNVYWGATLNTDAFKRTVEVIRESGADIVGIQEKMTYDKRGEAFSRNGAQMIAQELGWHFVDQRQKHDGTWDDTAIVSRLPVRAVSAGEFCVTLEKETKSFNFCNIHLFSYPYQPYQLLSIPYKNAPFIKTEAEAIEFSNKARGAGVPGLLADLATLDDSIPTIVTGDFNEPSHQDWTETAAAAGLHPIKVRYPQTEKLTEAGFVDAYRFVFPDEIGHAGQTWTPTTAPTAKDDHHDRIDFVFVKGADITIRDAAVLGEQGPQTDIVQEPWPSDHRAVTVNLDLK
jgi:endonuclease/exonuclease/phosphatase family metal-dependent hydrolase